MFSIYFSLGSTVLYLRAKLLISSKIQSHFVTEDKISLQPKYPVFLTKTPHMFALSLSTEIHPKFNNNLQIFVLRNITRFNKYKEIRNLYEPVILLSVENTKGQK